MKNPEIPEHKHLPERNIIDKCLCSSTKDTTASLRIDGSHKKCQTRDYSRQFQRKRRMLILEILALIIIGKRKELSGQDFLLWISSDTYGINNKITRELDNKRNTKLRKKNNCPILNERFYL